MNTSSFNNSLTIATRLHLGHASNPPPNAQLVETLSSFANLASTVKAEHAVIAVDAEDKIEGYSLVAEVTQICRSSLPENSTTIHILPITPWGKFVPALNAIVSWTARQKSQYLLLVSAEVQMTSDAMDALKKEMDIDTTLVVGAVLQGHQHQNAAVNSNENEVALTGRTTPWNTLALWNLPKLALTGFLLVSEGLHPDDGKEGAAGVEEVCTIATLQKLLPPNTAQAKLLSISGVQWGQDFGDDEGRKEWHERKMMSKITRAKRQLDLMGLSGTVLHC